MTLHVEGGRRVTPLRNQRLHVPQITVVSSEEKKKCLLRNKENAKGASTAKLPCQASKIIMSHCGA